MTDWRRPYGAYLFDLDGTLIDTAPDIGRALNHALQLADIDAVDISLTRHWVGHGARVLIEQAIAHHEATHGSKPGALQVEPMLNDFLDYYAAHLTDTSTFYPTVESTLATLKARGARLAVVTNKMAALSEPLIEQMGALGTFDLIVCGDTTNHPKPHPEPVVHTLTKLGVPASDALFVGDSETDVNAARAAGVPVVCMRDGYNHGIDVTTLGANAVIDKMDELLGA